MSLHEIIKSCLRDYQVFKQEIDNCKKIIEAENILAKVSNYDFVFAFRYTARSICESKATGNTETYISLCNEATEMCARGDALSDVLWHFDNILAELRGEGGLKP